MLCTDSIKILAEFWRILFTDKYEIQNEGARLNMKYYIIVGNSKRDSIQKVDDFA